MGGLGLSEFLNFNKDKAARAYIGNEWKKAGHLVIWLSTRAKMAYPTWHHPFHRLVTKEKDGKERQFLQFVRYASPDPAIIHREQYFRFRDGEGPVDRLRRPPIADPFLLLREWLRFECKEPNDAIVFEWINPDPDKNEIIRWRKGTLARLEEKNQRTWNQSIDTKLDYAFVVVDDSDPAKGPQIVRATKAIGEAMQKEIRKQVDSLGEKGNPQVHPYAFKWTYEKDAAIKDMYDAYKYEAAELTEEIREAITNPEFPDPTSDCEPKVGDKARLRADMEAAAQIDLPWDKLFVSAWQDKEPEGGGGSDFEFGENEREEKVPEVRTKGRQKEEAKPATPEGKTRRRKKEAPKPPPPPEPERIECETEGCGEMLLPTQETCPKCGAEYEIEVVEASEKVSTPKAKDNGNKASATKCWACGGAVKDTRCVDCGLDVTDDIDF